VHCAISGISERCGMPATEELAVALLRLYGVAIGLRLTVLPRIGKFLERACGLRMSAIKPVLGGNAFAYEVGPYIHSSDSRRVQYEPYDPAIVARNREASVSEGAA
jgi:isopropylmalate/homocitrate/citramalate synthase